MRRILLALSISDPTDSINAITNSPIHNCTMRVGLKSIENNLFNMHSFPVVFSSRGVVVTDSKRKSPVSCGLILSVLLPSKRYFLCFKI